MITSAMLRWLAQNVRMTGRVFSGVGAATHKRLHEIYVGIGLHWRRLTLLGLVFLLTGCTLAPYMPAIPATYRIVKSFDDRYELAYRQYQKEFPLGAKPGGSPKAIAEFYMQRFQPGPLPRIFEHSVLTDRHGVVLAELMDEGRRTWTPLERISPYVQKAVIATEDASFYENDGIDSKRLVRALMQNAQGGGVVSGGSTITMQLARNLFFVPQRRFEQTLDRKITEIFLAQDLTKMLSKEEILEMYLNLVYFGHRAYGVEAAAQVYFGKHAIDLTPGEATMLAGLPQSPAQLDPFIDFTAAKNRQRQVLDLLVRHGLMERELTDEIFYQDVALIEDSVIPTIKAPHFVWFIEGQIAEQYGVKLSRAGLHIQTTLDLSMQEMAQKIVAAQTKALGPQFNLSNAALVALKPPRAEIMVMVGSADFYNNAIAGEVNNATSLRQPGSTVKAMLYAAAFDDNLISPASILWDMPVRYTVAKIQTYIPANYDLKFHGPVTARTALANSYNVPAIKLIDAVGPDRMAQAGRAMGLLSLSDQPGKYNLPLTLGANEVSLIELTNAYHTLANAGQYTPFKYHISVTDGLGNPSPFFGEDQWWQTVSPQAAYLVTDILADKKARQPAFGINNGLNLSRPAAAKTGTSSSYRDNWTIGYTRYLVAGVWAGNSNGRPMRNASGITGAAPIWNKFMEGVITNTAMLEALGAPSDPAAWDFQPPDGVIEQPLACPKEIYCPNKSEQYTVDWLRKTGREGPTGDGMAARDRIARVWVQRPGDSFVAGACSTANGDERTLVMLPTGFGTLSPPPMLQAQVLQGLTIQPHVPAPSLRSWQISALPAKVDEKIQRERLVALNWSNRAGTLLNFGPCRTVADVVKGIYGANAQAVVAYPTGNQIAQASAAAAAQPIADTTTANNTLTPTATPSDPTVAQTPEATATAAATPEPLSTPQPPVPNNGYLLASLHHDNSCAGNYILGVVQNEQGAPLAGVRITAVDQWGNYAESVSKAGSGDYGMWDIPLDFRVRDFTVQVVDPVGVPLSPAITVNHAGDGGDKCHHIVFRRAGV